MPSKSSFTGKMLRFLKLVLSWARFVVELVWSLEVDWKSGYEDNDYDEISLEILAK